MKKIIFLFFAALCWQFTISQRVEWVDYVNSTNHFNKGKGIVSDNAGNVYTLGDIEDQIVIQGDTFNNQYGATDLILIKYSPQGSLVWAKVFGSFPFDAAYHLSIDAANHLYAEVFIQTTTMMNDTTYTAAHDNQVIQFDTASNFLRYVTRNTIGIISGANGYNVYLAYNATIEKCDTAFNTIWSRTGSNNTMNFSRAGWQPVNGTIMFGNNGHLVVSGYENGNGGAVIFDTVSFSFSSVNNLDELFVISMDTSGAALWARTLDSSSTVRESPPRVAIDDAGNVYLALYSAGAVMYFANDTLFNIPSSTPYSAVLKYNASGIPEWGIGYYTNSHQTYIYDMLINPQQDLVVCGWSAGMGQFGNYALPAYSSAALLPFVAKVNPSGMIEWYKTNEHDIVGGSMRFNSIAMTPNGNYAVTGHYPPSFGLQIPYRFGCFPAPLGSRDILTFVLSENPEPVPVADFNLLFEEGKAYFENKSINEDNIEWNFGDGQSNTVQQNPIHAYPEPGLYKACLTASNGCGSDSSCKTILVPGIEKVTPNHLANTGYHPVNITGGFPFTTGTVTFVKSGQPDIIPGAVFFKNSGLIQANLKLNSAASGNWDLVITSGAFRDTLYSAITIEQPDTFNIKVQFTGAGKTLVNTWWPDKIMLTNMGNRTEIGIPIYITVSPDAEIMLQYHELNDAITRQVIDTIGNFTMLHDTVAGDSVLFGAFLIPYLSPGHSTELKMLIKATTPGLKIITARVGTSYFNEQDLANMDLKSSCNFFPPCVQCAIDLAGFVPFLGCASSATNLSCAIAKGYTGYSGGGALDITGAAVSTLLSCAAPIAPVAVACQVYKRRYS